MFQEEFGLPVVDWKCVSKGELLASPEHIMLEDTVEHWLNKRFGSGSITAAVVSINHPYRGGKLPRLLTFSAFYEISHILNAFLSGTWRARTN